jgi:hypothetical protein
MFSSKYLLYVQRQQRRAAGTPLPSTKAKAFEDCTDGSKNAQDNDRTSANVGSLETTIPNAGRTLIFRKNMDEKEILRELFIMECESDFETQPLKSKMMKVIRVSVPELKDWFYEKGVEGKLPDEWEEFKIQIVNLCTEQALESLYRYKDEPWSAYISRLKDKGISTNTSEDEVFKKLRRESAPEILRQIFYSFGISLEQTIERVKEYEINAKEMKERFTRLNIQTSEKSFQDREGTLPGSCYVCNKQGHYSANCPNKHMKESINHLNKDLSSYSNLDLEVVKINGV